MLLATEGHGDPRLLLRSLHVCRSSLSVLTQIVRTLLPVSHTAVRSLFIVNLTEARMTRENRPGNAGGGGLS